MSHDGHYDLVTCPPGFERQKGTSQREYLRLQVVGTPDATSGCASEMRGGIIGRSQLKGDPGGIIYLLQGRECRSIKEVESEEVVRLLRQNEELLSSLVTTQ